MTLLALSTLHQIYSPTLTALPEDLPEAVSIDSASPVDATPDLSPTLTALPEDLPEAVSIDSADPVDATPDLLSHSHCSTGRSP